MELKDRIATVIKDNNLKQRELAALIGVTESYISTLLSGRSKNISVTIATLLEEKLGYNAQWLLSGEEPKYKKMSKNPNISEVHRLVIRHLETMRENEVAAVLAFINSLDDVSRHLSAQREDDIATDGTNVLKIAGRDGSYLETAQTDAQVEEARHQIARLPDVPADL